MHMLDIINSALRNNNYYICLYKNTENAEEKFNFVKTYLYYSSQKYLKKDEENNHD